MKSLFFSISILLLSVLLASCEAIGSIFKAGMWTGVLAVVLLVGVIIYFIGRSRK